MEDWIEALSLILKIFTAYTAVISIFSCCPGGKYPGRRPGPGLRSYWRPGMKKL